MLLSLLHASHIHAIVDSKCAEGISPTQQLRSRHASGYLGVVDQRRRLWSQHPKAQHLHRQ